MDTPVKFLLVDDMEENLLALAGLLRRDGLELLQARSGTEALELLVVHEVALAILDVQMPGIDGFELAELMRGTLRTKHIPIIFLTAAGFDDRRRFRGYEAGAVDFLFKPIEPTVLQGKADVFFDLYRQRQGLVRQRDELRAAAEENDRLFREIMVLNESLEERVKERTLQLEEANEQLQGFAYSIAHDFRQYIRNVNINAEMVMAEAPEILGSHLPNLERISQAAKLMSKMTDDLLSYARMRTVVLRPVRIDLTELSREIAEAYKAAYPNTRVEIADKLSVCGDQTLFRIVLDNLLSNAFKYSHNAKTPLVEVGRDFDGFYVRDNGIGFDMAYSNKLFLPFERLQPGAEYSGTGMGLANVKRILDRHGGSISVNSEPEKGAIFHFTLEKSTAPTPKVDGRIQSSVDSSSL